MSRMAGSCACGGLGVDWNPLRWMDFGMNRFSFSKFVFPLMVGVCLAPVTAEDWKVPGDVVHAVSRESERERLVKALSELEGEPLEALAFAEH